MIDCSYCPRCFHLQADRGCLTAAQLRVAMKATEDVDAVWKCPVCGGEGAADKDRSTYLRLLQPFKGVWRRLAMDRYFTTLKLIDSCTSLQIVAFGTVMSTRLAGSPVLLGMGKHSPRGACHAATIKVDNGGATSWAWKDVSDKPMLFFSNVFGVRRGQVLRKMCPPGSPAMSTTGGCAGLSLRPTVPISTSASWAPSIASIPCWYRTCLACAWARCVPPAATRACATTRNGGFRCSSG